MAASGKRARVKKLDFGHFILELIKDLVAQSWTLLGLTVAWLVLEGSAKALTGTLILVTLVFWVLTFPIRYEQNVSKKDDRD